MDEGSDRLPFDPAQFQNGDSLVRSAIPVLTYTNAPCGAHCADAIARATEDFHREYAAASEADPSAVNVSSSQLLLFIFGWIAQANPVQLSAILKNGKACGTSPPPSPS